METRGMKRHGIVADEGDGNAATAGREPSIDGRLRFRRGAEPDRGPPDQADQEQRAGERLHSPHRTGIRREAQARE